MLLPGLFVILFLQHAAVAAEAPDFGPNVLIFDPSMLGIQKRMDAIFADQEKGQFNSNRYAYLFKPGKYALDVQMGFYMQAAGLGASPDDVTITGAVRSKATWMNGNATCNFWRCIENLSIVPTLENKTNIWAVSQGTALRRVHVKGDLSLWDHGWSSGGFLADSKIDGRVDAGSQQQWFARNSSWGDWRGGDWNMVFLGVTHGPKITWPAQPFTVIDKTPVMREKPYLFIDGEGRYFVMAPGLRRDLAGNTWGDGTAGGQTIPLGQFLIARPDRDDARTINEALERGENILLTPGIYHLQASIRINRPGTVVLGLGYPTLVPDTGEPAMVVSDVDGADVSGILFDAGKMKSPVLLQIGDSVSSASHAGNPTVLHDIFCRAGGAGVGKTGAFVVINANDVIGDNAWLWRADHGDGVGWDQNQNVNGLVVNGRNVTYCGLFVEHCQEYQTVWNGNGGRVYFYQSEMPYDPPTQSAWWHGDSQGFASYKVGDGVSTHEAWGLGIYCVFTSAVVADRAIETPSAAGVRMHHMVTLRFGGEKGSGIAHVINNQGDGVISRKMARVN